MDEPYFYVPITWTLFLLHFLIILFVPHYSDTSVRTSVLKIHQRLRLRVRTSVLIHQRLRLLVDKPTNHETAKSWPNVSTLSAHFRDRKHRQSLFKRLGVKGPAPSLVMGNFAEIQDKVLFLV